MKVNVEIDCTPQEARQFFGLPDVQPMQTAVMEKLQHQMIDNIQKVSPDALMQSWLSFDPKFAERFSDMFAAMTGLGGEFEEAARVAGASSWWAWIRINLPLLAPAVALAFLAIFAEVVADFGMAATIARAISVVVALPPRSGVSARRSVSTVPMAARMRPAAPPAPCASSRSMAGSSSGRGLARLTPTVSRLPPWNVS